MRRPGRMTVIGAMALCLVVLAAGFKSLRSEMLDARDLRSHRADGDRERRLAVRRLEESGSMRVLPSLLEYLTDLESDPRKTHEHLQAIRGIADRNPEASVPVLARAL